MTTYIVHAPSFVCLSVLFVLIRWNFSRMLSIVSLFLWVQLLLFLTYAHTLSQVRGNCDCFQHRLFPVHYFFHVCALPMSAHIQLKCTSPDCAPASRFVATDRTVTHADCCVNIKLTWWQFKRNMAWHNWHQYSLSGLFANVSHFPLHFIITKPYIS